MSLPRFLLGTFLIVCLSFFRISSFGQTPKGAQKAPCMTCADITKLRLPDVRILKTIEENKASHYCKVLGVIGTEINFELLLPQKWNQRYVMGGGGGYVGNIQNSARKYVHQGFATSVTDTGHKGPGVVAEWALNNLERQVNFGHLAIHRTAEVSKVIIHHGLG